MEHSFETKVYYADTDSYGAVWHGNYVRWLEKGRTDFCEQAGYNLSEIAISDDIIFPVAELDIKYKAFARLNDDLIVTTKLESIKNPFFIFYQEIKNKNTDKIHIKAHVKIIAVNNAGCLYRKLPEKILTGFEKLVEKN